MIVLALLVIADAHIATALVGHHTIVEPTCGARLPTLTRDASPAVLQSVAPRPVTVSQSPSPLLHGPALASSALEPLVVPTGSWPQGQLQAFVHVFLY
jgi:hypothetical protein